MDHRGHAVIDDAFAGFSTRLATAGGIAHREESTGSAVRTITALLAETAQTTIWVSSTVRESYSALASALESAGCTLCVPDGPAAVRDQPVGMTIARIAIRETGSVLLVEPDVADRSVSLMTNLLIVICPVSQLVPSLDEAAPILRDISRTGSSYATFVTGPSRTADIERQLTVGVQGPGAMHVIFLP